MFSHQARWTSADIGKWKKQRGRGRQYFIIWNGILYRGITLFVITTVLLLFFETSGNPIIYPPRSGFYIVVVIIAIICLITGYLTGKWTWEVNERLYQRYIKASNH